MPQNNYPHEDLNFPKEWFVFIYGGWEVSKAKRICHFMWSGIMWANCDITLVLSYWHRNAVSKYHSAARVMLKVKVSVMLGLVFRVRFRLHRKLV